jgi:hypothetical protein
MASNATVVGSAVDVSTKIGGAFIGIHFGRRTAAALTEGVLFRVEGSTKSSGNGYWFPIGMVKTGIAAAESEPVSGTVNAGTTTITLSSTTNIGSTSVPGSFELYIDNSTIANSEFQRITSISTNTSATIEDALTNAQTGSTVYTQAQFFGLQFDITDITRIRVVADGHNTGQAVAIEAYMVTGDSIG